MLLHSDLRNRFDLSHVDTMQHQPNPNMGRFNLSTLFFALSNIFHVFRTIVYRSPLLVYMLISPSILGLVRDSVFILESKLLGRKVVIHLHSGYQIQEVYAQAPTLVRALAHWACHKVDRAIVLQTAFMDAFTELVPREHIVVIPNGVPDVLSGYRGHEQKATLNNSKVVTYLSNLQEGKGYNDFLEAARLIATERNDVRFVVAGTWFDEEEKRATLSWITAGGLGSRIEFPGVVLGKAKAHLLLGSNVFVFPAFDPEGQPLVLLEAMAAALPIVTTDQGVLPQIVTHGRNGFVVPFRNPIALARAITRLLDDDELRERIGKTNRAEYLEKYTAEKCIQRMGDLFEQVLNS